VDLTDATEPQRPFKIGLLRADFSGMFSAQILAGIGNGLFTLAMLVAVIRLLLLWRRSRQLPELAVGAGFALIAGVGLPAMVIGGIAAESNTQVDYWLLGFGLVIVAVGVFAVQVFTWKVFRPDAAWAAALAWGSLVAGVVIAAGSLRTIAAAPPDVAPAAAGTSWWLALRLLFEVWYVWTGVESLREYVKARRRLALGLSDPVAANRFLLWGAMGAYLALNGAVAMALEQSGMTPMKDSLPALVLGANGIGAGLLITLTFMPPKSYCDWIRRRAAAEAS
jgi:hypothetical protein